MAKVSATKKRAKPAPLQPTASAPDWQPSRNHKAYLLAWLELGEEGLSESLSLREEARKRVGLGYETIRRWFRNPAFCQWFGNAVMDRYRLQRYRVFRRLLEVIEQPGVSERDVCTAARVYLEHIPEAPKGSHSALRELFSRMRAAPENIEVQAAWQEGADSTTLVSMSKRVERRSRLDSLVEQGKKLGVTECSPTGNPDTAASRALSEMALRYASDAIDAEIVDRGTGSDGSVPPAVTDGPSSTSGDGASAAHNATSVPEGVGGQESRPGTPPDSSAPPLRTAPAREKAPGRSPSLDEGGVALHIPDPSSPPPCPCGGGLEQSEDGRVWKCRRMGCGRRWLTSWSSHLSGEVAGEVEARAQELTRELDLEVLVPGRGYRAHCPQCCQATLLEEGGGWVCVWEGGSKRVCGWSGPVSEVDWRDMRTGESMDSRFRDPPPPEPELMTEHLALCPECKVESDTVPGGEWCECCLCGLGWNPLELRVSLLERREGPPFGDCEHGRRASATCRQCHENRRKGISSGRRPWKARALEGLEKELKDDVWRSQVYRDAQNESLRRRSDGG